MDITPPEDGKERDIGASTEQGDCTIHANADYLRQNVPRCATADFHASAAAAGHASKSKPLFALGQHISHFPSVPCSPAAYPRFALIRGCLYKKLLEVFSPFINISLKHN
jgi:hypothetical protein